MNLLYKILKEKIKNNDFLFIALYTIRAYIYNFINRISYYQIERRGFYKNLGYQSNLKHPHSYNEKILWKKIYDRNPLLPITADKYQVRSYLKEILGKAKAEEILIPLLYVTDRPETIPFDRLPPNFIVKPNHASGFYTIVEKGNLNKHALIKTCQKWLSTTYALEKLEWAYQPIRRKILIEELLIDNDGDLPKRFKFHMFHGKCKLIHVFFGRNNHFSLSHFDEKWNFLPVRLSSIAQGPRIVKPKSYEMMLKLAEELAQPFDYVRVDLYNIGKKIYFGELTHYPESGRGKFEPDSFDFKLGKFWKILPRYWKNI